MASGKVYFWEHDTDEVAWEPPPGGYDKSYLLTLCFMPWGPAGANRQNTTHKKSLYIIPHI